MRGRRGAVLPLTIVLSSVAAALLGVLFVVLFEDRGLLELELETERGRSEMISRANAALRWVRGELASNRRPRAAAGPLSNFDARRVFLCDEENGVRAGVYDLDYDARLVNSSVSDGRSFSPPLADGLLIRAWSEGARRVVEAVYVVRSVVLPDGSMRPVLEERPRMWREVWL